MKTHPLIWAASLLGLAGLAGGYAMSTATPVGRFFDLSEFTKTKTGLPNQPDVVVIENIKALTAYVLDKLRAHLGVPVRITSGFRSPQVNTAVGGAQGSQHVTGEAADIKVDGYTAEQLLNAIVALGLPFDQAIVYAPERGGHLHVSFKRVGMNRGMALRAPAGGGYVQV